MHRHLARVRAAILAEVEGLSSAQAETKPARGWSIANILEHLDLTFTRNADGFERRLQKGTPPPPVAVTTYQRIGRLLITRLGYFPRGRSSPEVVLPTGRSFAELMVVIDPHLMRLDQLLLQAERAFGARGVVVNHPVLGPFTIKDWRRFHWVHTRHHMKQIRQLRRSPNPGAHVN